MRYLAAVAGVMILASVGWADAPPTAKEALQAFNDLIGSWRVTGSPEGTQAERQAGFWTEKLAWEWQFKGADAWLKFTSEGGKHFTAGELHYRPQSDDYSLTVQTPKGPLNFAGKFGQKKLILDRTDDSTKEVQRLTIALLHNNRYVYRFETKALEQIDFVKRWQAGATKEGEPFAASGSSGPECIVSGGLGTIKVTYKGQTYYVCCTGCRDAFLEEPDKYIREAAEKKKKQGK
jgi:YHS domain